MGDLSPFFQGNLHDRYGHIVALYAKYLSLKIEFHSKVTHVYLFLFFYTLLDDM